MRNKINHLVSGQGFHRFIIGVILLNTLLLIFETDAAMGYMLGHLFQPLYVLISFIFVIEMALKFYAWRWEFFDDGWNMFDLLVVVVTTIPTASEVGALRSLRALRLLRLTSSFPNLRKVIESLLRAVPGVMSVVVIFLLIYLIAAIMATLMFRDMSPDYFGSLLTSSFTLFQIMTLEAWASNVARPIIEDNPMASVFFVVFIIVTNFVLINFFVAVFIEASQSAREGDVKKLKTLEDKIDRLLEKQEQKR